MSPSYNPNPRIESHHATCSLGAELDRWQYVVRSACGKLVVSNSAKDLKAQLSVLAVKAAAK